MITPANVDGRKPVPEMTQNLFGNTIYLLVSV